MDDYPALFRTDGRTNERTGLITIVPYLGLNRSKVMGQKVSFLAKMGILGAFLAIKVPRVRESEFCQSEQY